MVTRQVLRGLVRAAVEVGTELGAAAILAAHRRWDRFAGRIRIHQHFEDQDPDWVFNRIKQDLEAAAARARASRMAA